MQRVSLSLAFAAIVATSIYTPAAAAPFSPPTLPLSASTQPSNVHEATFFVRRGYHRSYRYRNYGYYPRYRSYYGFAPFRGYGWGGNRGRW